MSARDNTLLTSCGLDSVFALPRRLMVCLCDTLQSAVCDPHHARVCGVTGTRAPQRLDLYCRVCNVIYYLPRIHR